MNSFLKTTFVQVNWEFRKEGISISDEKESEDNQ
jgi:hypothetical protein